MTGKPEDDGLAEIKRLLRSLDETSAGDRPPSIARTTEKRADSLPATRLQAAPPSLGANLPAAPRPQYPIGLIPPPPPPTAATGSTPNKWPVLAGIAIATLAGAGLAAWQMGGVPSSLSIAGRTANSPSTPALTTSAPPPDATAVQSASLAPPPAAPAERPEIPPSASPSSPSSAAPPPAAQAAAPDAGQKPAAAPEAAAPTALQPRAAAQVPTATMEPLIRAPARLAASAGQTLPLQIDVETAALSRGPAGLVVAGLPQGATMNKGSPLHTNAWTVGATDLAGLTLSVPAVASGRHHLTIELRSFDGAVLSTARSLLDVAQAPPKSPMADSVRPSEATTSAWLADARRLLSTGQIASARLLLERAADGGHPEAARLLGDTFDPAKLYALGVHGLSGDIQKAIHWYERADELGDPQAKARLLSLGGR